MAASPTSKFIQHLRGTLHPRDKASLSDGQLLECFINQRDEVAFAALVRRHGPMVWGVCRRVLRGHQDAEDAFQATFLVLVRKAASLASRELLANWLYGVAHRIALKAQAATVKRQMREKQVTAMPESGTAPQSPCLDLLPLLDQALSKLPDKYRVPVVLCDLEGKTRKEAARQLGCPEGTVAGRLARARTMLAKRLARHGLAISGGSLAVVLSEIPASASVPASVVTSTIKAATLAAAGQAATPGLISAHVAALTEGMLNTMLMTKVKIALAVLLVASTVALTCGVLAGRQQPRLPDDVKAKPPSKPVEPPKEDKDKLQGTWQLVVAENDGLRFGEGRPEVKDTRFVFKKTSVTLFGKIFHDPRIHKEPEDSKSVGVFQLDKKKSSKVMVLTLETNPWNDKKDFTQRYIYALDGDSLKLCGSIPNEAKQVLPTEFSAEFGSKRILLTFKRVPPSGKGEEKKDASKADLKRIQGTWRAVSGSAGGAEVPFAWTPEANKLCVFWADNWTTSIFKGGAAVTFKLDATKNPRAIDLHPTGGKETTLGIYELDGDNLKLCYCIAGAPGVPAGKQERPSKFANKADVILLVLKRHKIED